MHALMGFQMTLPFVCVCMWSGALSGKLYALMEFQKSGACETHDRGLLRN